MTESKSQPPRVTFRFPDHLRARLEEAAKANNRSVNAEVVSRLEASLSSVYDLDEVGAMANDHEERISELERDIVRLLDQTGLTYQDMR